MKVYLVGGAVRDKLLGNTVHERDYVVVGATAEQMLARGFRQVGKDFPVFLHPDTNEEYALARTERKAGRGYTGFAVDAAPSVTLEEDLLRRDLTINAIAQDADGELIDPYGGLQDIQSRTLRHVSDAFVEDPLRILRVARFAARFAEDGFSVASETLELMRKMSAADELRELANERVWQETKKALNSSNPATYIRVLTEANALSPWFCELEDKLTREVVLQRLEGLPEQHAELAFALWHGELSEAQVEASNQRLRVPSEYAKMGHLANQWHAAKHELTDPETLNDCLTKADCWRRAERFAKLVAIWCRQGMTDAQAQRITQAFDAAQAVAAKELIQAAHARGETLTGPAIGEEVQRARLATISAHLNKFY